MIKKILFSVVLLALTTNFVYADTVWINDLRNLFLSKNAIIYEINIRTFAAQDTNKNGIIDEDEESGNFLNAIGRLDEIKSMGINTLHVMPIMELGRTHALGNAGSLYAPVSFVTLNHQLKSKRSALSLESQAMLFFKEAHKRKMRIIVDLPACASYDLFLKNPELFLKDHNGNPVINDDWKDVVFLDGGSETRINNSVYKLYKDYVDYVIKLGADGIRVDVASIKPAKFWKDLIEYSRHLDPQFMWLAESCDTWKPVSDKIIFTPYDKLLEAGFDGFYGAFPELKNWNKASDLMNYVHFINNLKYNEPKAVIGSFSTHDELSPILIGGPMYSSMIIWLNATLPVNSYFVDGFATGDNYVYWYANKKVFKTETDCPTYYVSRGRLDIFNFSRKPEGNLKSLQEEFIAANGFKYYISNIITNGKFTELKTSNPSVFAYAQSYANRTVLVFGNMNKTVAIDATIKVPGFNDSLLVIPIKLSTSPVASDNKFTVKLNPYEIQVLYVDNFEVK